MVFSGTKTKSRFLELLKEELDADPIPLLNQAEGYRVRQKTPDLKPGAKTSTQRTSKIVENEVPPVIEAQRREEPENEATSMPDLPTVEGRLLLTKLFR